MSGGGFAGDQLPEGGQEALGHGSGRPWRQNTERRAQMRAASSSRVSGGSAPMAVA